MQKILIALAVLACAVEAQAQTPTPIQTKQRTMAAPTQSTSVMRPRPQLYGNWQRFKGASRCEQVDNVLTCDNGYRQILR